MRGKSWTLKADFSLIKQHGPNEIQMQRLCQMI